MSVRKRIWRTAAGEQREAWLVGYKDGEGHRRFESFKLKRDADAREAEVKTLRSRGSIVAPSRSITFAQACENWIKQAEVDGVEKATLLYFRQHAKIYIIPLLGQRKLCDFTLVDLVNFETALKNMINGRGGPMSPTMERKVRGSLGAILGLAVDMGLVARNVVRDAGRRRRRNTNAEKRSKQRLKVGVDIPTPSEIAAILGHASPRWRPVLATAAMTGLRASEVRGLTWQDVDLKKRELHVRQRADRYNTLGDLKSEASNRVVPLHADLVAILREWKLACPIGELVFPNGNGRVEALNNILTRGWHRAQILAGVVGREGGPKYTGFHSLRHFFASWCINRRSEGGLEVPPKVAQTWLGHSTVGMTLDVYGHLFPGSGASMFEAPSLLEAT
jgi:integrase